MPRPNSPHPTPGELEVLQVLWEQGACTVREVMDALNTSRPRGYTSVMSLLNVMFDKGLLTRSPEGRAYRYAAKVKQGTTRKKMLNDLLERAFAGSAELLITQALGQTNLDARQLENIRRLIEEHQKSQER